MKTKKIKHTYPSGAVYEGEWLAGMPHGKGRQTWLSGEVYEGDWIRGLRTGRGKLTYPAGHVYEGDFFNNKKNGQGRVTLVNDNFYIGQFKEDVKHGRGIERVDRVTKKGVWQNGNFSYDAYVSEKEFDYHLNQKYARSSMINSYRETPTGLQYKILREGSGGKPSRSGKVTINYTLTLADGTFLESSASRGGPQTRKVAGNIDGITEGLLLMSQNSTWQFRIPPDLAYGPSGHGPVPPDSHVMVKIELLDNDAS